MGTFSEEPVRADAPRPLDELAEVQRAIDEARRRAAPAGQEPMIQGRIPLETDVLGRRFWATVIDLVLMQIVSGTLAWLTEPMVVAELNSLNIVPVFGFSVQSVAGRLAHVAAVLLTVMIPMLGVELWLGRSVGKHIGRLKIADRSGAPASRRRIALRFVYKWGPLMLPGAFAGVSEGLDLLGVRPGVDWAWGTITVALGIVGLAGWIGWLIVYYRDDRLALHDLLAGTQVTHASRPILVNRAFEVIPGRGPENAPVERFEGME